MCLCCGLGVWDGGRGVGGGGGCWSGGGGGGAVLEAVNGLIY